MKKRIGAGIVSLSIFISAPVLARDISVEITNLTNGTWFTPLLVAAHKHSTRLFELGTEATPALQAMAEGGDISGLIGDVEAAGGEYVANPAGDVLPPGASTKAILNVRGRNQTHLSIVAMLLPTNDGFVGLDSMKIPRWRGTYTYDLYGYDAGTEANDEIVNGGGAPGTPGIPADPGMKAGTGATAIDNLEDINNKVHIHRGIIGDDNPEGGSSDLDKRIHRWLNPVARVKVHVGHHYYH